MQRVIYFKRAGRDKVLLPSEELLEEMYPKRSYEKQPEQHSCSATLENKLTECYQKLETAMDLMKNKPVFPWQTSYIQFWSRSLSTLP